MPAALLGALLMTTTLHLPLERYVLPNGLAVVLHEDHRLPNVVVDLTFRVGSKDEKAGRTGFAHLFEHLMFMGTKNVPNGTFDTILEGNGGYDNASTSEDVTNYFETGPSNLLETFLWLEADRLSSLSDDMTKAKIDLQRDVVKNERRQSYENQPYGRAELVLPDKLYPASHPYHHPVIGSHADLNAASVEDVKAFFRQFYVPSNASLVISGDFSSAAARALVDKYFAWMPKRPLPPHAEPRPVTLAKPARVRLTDAVQLGRVILAWHSPAAYADGDAECDLLAAVLGGGHSSRLYQRLVYADKLAESVDVEQRTSFYGSQLVVVATAQSGHTSAELERAIDDELRRVDTSPPTPSELERARAFVQTKLLHDIEPPVQLATTLNMFEARFGDAGELSRRYLARYDGVTAPSLAKWTGKVLHAPHLTVVIDPEASK
ncbi:MAG TPA: pitrilysin family protein [Polyangia bacterium]|jgi:predicted Zn-dependent peptidase|nr:pitrilysin family protein [Polyangia bacterium]